MRAVRRVRHVSGTSGCRPAPLRRVSFLLFLAAACTSALRAQDEQTAPYTFHVYEDLVQVPTLVLNRLHASYPGLAPPKFSVRLDSGPAFHPRHVRLQGSDPISFALLLDVADEDGQELAKAFAAAAHQLPPDLFGPEDTLSVFAVDCVLVRSARTTTPANATPANAMPANLAALEFGMAQALESTNVHQAGPEASCGDARRLWDSVARVAFELRAEPGRRVLLVLSDGIDRKSHQSWERAREVASLFSVTVVALRPAVTPRIVDAAEHDHPFAIITEDPLSLLCGETGGIDLYGTPRSVGPLTARLVDLLRHRYILEFARPSNATSGRHSIDVTVSDRHAIVRTSGATFPLPDKANLNDAHTIPSDPARAPLFGSRKALTLTAGVEPSLLSQSSSENQS